MWKFSVDNIPQCVLICPHTEHNLQKFTIRKEINMSEKEKTILENLGKSLEKATDAQKEYLLGLADGMALMAEGKKPEPKEQE
jgi:hypothetical protein